MEKRKMDRLAECGHPISCLRADGIHVICGWCEDIERLREENDSLRAQLRKDAVIVNGGELHFDRVSAGGVDLDGPRAD